MNRFSNLIDLLRKNVLVGILGLVLLVSLCFIFVRSEQLTLLDANHDDLSVRRTRVLKNFRNGSDIASNLDRIKLMQEEAQSRLFRAEDLAANQRYFYQIESATGISILNMHQAVKQLPAGKKNRKARALAARSKYETIVYDISLFGDYEQILDFFRHVEGGRAFARIDGFALSRGKGGAGSSMINARVSVEVLGSKS